MASRVTVLEQADIWGSTHTVAANGKPPDQPEQLQLEQPLTHPHLFADLGSSRCEHESVRGNRCTQPGQWDGLHGKVLCDQHANNAA